MKKPPKNLGLLFDWHAEQSRTTKLILDRPFDIAPEAGADYDAAALAGLVREASGWLYAAGARKGDRIAVVKRNHFDMILLAAAAARIGATAATISGANYPEHLAVMLKRLDPSVTLITSQVLEEADRVGVDLTSFGRTVLIDGAAADPGAGLLTIDGLRGSATPTLDLRADGELMMITHTSGTTNTPKLVAHTADSCRAGTRLELLPMPLAVNGPKDVSLSSISFAHSRAYAWAMAQLRWAPKALVIASSHEVEDLERVLDRVRPTTIEATPNVFQRWVPLVRRRPELFARVRYYMNTFDLMHPSIARPFVNASKRRLVLWGHSWGQSEVGPMAGFGYTRGQINRRAASGGNMNMMGNSWPGLVSVKAADPETGAPVKHGQVGVLFAKSKSICVDYVGESDRHAEKLKDSWWNTGDVGYKDALGRIHFVDRAVDAIPGGSATELESELLDRIENAVEAIVLTRGDRSPVPVISLDGPDLSAEEWAEATRGLPPLEAPVFIPWDRLPRTSTWKVRRKELRTMVFAESPDTTELEERFT
ncbi:MULTISPECIES: class I adenylate-forming enzyme family protein [unclassified Streptomyces]|uniref:class I adenylate-forming enzyme family protein n=1 Tax=unclassified Streptomyces TaxID=2593676 RepID=UPI002E2B9A9D|nr:class I adenylate-forming enzyme family protein [Streptomyces sp. NBC_00223]